MKKLIVIIIILSGVVLSGCGIKEKEVKFFKDYDFIRGVGKICIEVNGKSDCIDSFVKQEELSKLQQTQDERWEMIKDYLGVVEWSENFDICSTSTVKGIIVNDKKIYLTSDENKVEWMELGCEKQPLDTPQCCFEENGCSRNFQECPVIWKETFNRCKELKDLIN